MKRTSQPAEAGHPLLYYITDRQQVPGGDVVPFIAAAARAGVDLIQVREKDLDTRALTAVLAAAATACAGTNTRLLVNDRLDVALAVGPGVAGVHLPDDSFPPSVIRERFGRQFLLAVSCHSREEVERAERAGADFVVFGPVFETVSKRPYGPPLGLERLREACESVQIPVLALGGIRLENARACLEAGASGLAAISLFQTAASMESLVRELRALGQRRADVTDTEKNDQGT